MRTTIAKVFLPILALLLTVGVDQAFAQAMVSYGHGVAKAAGAGAAVGAGVGGLLTGLGNPLSKAAGDADGPANRSIAHRQVVPQRKDDVELEEVEVAEEGEAFGQPAPLDLAGGVQVNGAAQANWQPTRLAPSQNIAVLKTSWGGSGFTPESGSAPARRRTRRAAATQTEAVALAPNAGPTAAGAPAPAPGVAAVEPANASGEEGPKLPIIIRSTAGPSAFRGGRRAAAAPVPPAPELPEGVAVGLTMDQIIEKLGRPHMAFRGVAGQGYTDQYVFELPDGTNLVVYVLDGIVSHLASS